MSWPNFSQKNNIGLEYESKYNVCVSVGGWLRWAVWRQAPRLIKMLPCEAHYLRVFLKEEEYVS